MIHILTLNWNGLNLLQQLKPGLESNCKNLSYNWLIRDNGSTDGSVAELAKWPNTTTLGIVNNRASFSVGVNSLFELANPADDDFVLLLNNDIIFKNESSITEMIDLMFKTKAAVVGCRLTLPNSNVLSHAGVTFHSNRNKLPWNFGYNTLSNKYHQKNKYFQAVTGACLLTTGYFFKKVNGLNPNLIWSFDDVDFCLQLAINHQQKIAYCGTTEIEHGTSVSLKKNPVNKLFLSQNVKYFQTTWGGKYQLDEELYLKDPNFNIIS